MRWLLGILLASALNSLFAAEFQYQPALADNPLKGLVFETREKDVPHSMVYIQLPLALLMPNPTETDWNAFEKRLVSAASSGKQALVRVYLEWPGRTNSFPPFLDPASVEKSWMKGGRVIDYTAPLVRETVTNFIAAFARSYDGDPRIGFIEAGLLGFWGEGLEGYNAGPPEVRSMVLSAYASAFKRTKILARLPSLDSIQFGFGYHDDWFGGPRGGLRQHFEALGMRDPATWKTAPIAGRIHPEIQHCIWDPDPCRGSEEHYLRELRYARLSFLRVGQWGLPQSAARSNAVARAALFGQSLGYELHVRRASILFRAPERLSISVTLTNSGNAPFYYKWPVEIGINNRSNISEKRTVHWDIRTIIPGAGEITFEANLDLPIQSAKGAAVFMRIPNPMPQGKPLRFANKEQDQDFEGWLTLGQL